jgi:hypothetical protein
MPMGMDKRANIPDAVPKASSEPLPEISSFLEPFAPLFRCSQSRHHLERYVTGLLTDLDCKNCDTIAAALAATERDEQKRSAFRQRLRGVDPERFIFVDESSTNVALTPRDTPGRPKEKGPTGKRQGTGARTSR